MSIDSNVGIACTVRRVEEFDAGRQREQNVSLLLLFGVVVLLLVI